LGSTLALRNIPEGTQIYNIETKPAGGGSLVRASGATAKLSTITEKGVLVIMPSRKQKLFNPECRATIGRIAGGGKKEKPFVKAGNKFHAMKAKGKLYPRTSGVAMNAVDHPFGSGRGRHAGKPLTAPRFAPPGRNVGKIKARRTGKRN
jgi:large subunit ribosomal protein L2